MGTIDLWLKAAHTILVSRFAGVFCLRRIDAYPAPVDDAATCERLLLMTRTPPRYRARRCGTCSRSAHSHSRFPRFNEVPVVWLAGIVILVVVKLI